MELRKVYQILQDTSLGQDLKNEELQRLAEIGLSLIHISEPTRPY